MLTDIEGVIPPVFDIRAESNCAQKTNMDAFQACGVELGPNQEVLVLWNRDKAASL